MVKYCLLPKTNSKLVVFGCIFQGPSAEEKSHFIFHINCYHIDNLLCFHFDNVVVVCVLYLLQKKTKRIGNKRYEFLLIILINYEKFDNVANIL